MFEHLRSVEACHLVFAEDFACCAHQLEKLSRKLRKLSAPICLTKRVTVASLVPLHAAT